ncbi:MAG: CHAP domain-containing protein [Acetobacteraceae bacterium]
MRRVLLCSFLPLLLALAGCGSSTSSNGRVGDYVGGPVRVECAPFARALSGVRLSGAAADWWWQADGQYARSNAPRVGSVLVLSRTGRLRSGHVAVVSKVLSSREILVTQANWVRNRITEDQPVIDVSPGNDWTMVRVWWPPSGQMGVSQFPAHGFILAERPKSRDELMATTPRAIQIALAGW